MVESAYSMDNVGANIRRLRTQRGWSQDALGERLDVTKSSVSQWESGQTVPRKGKLEEIARLFGVTVLELLTQVLDGSDTSTIRGDEVALLGNYRRLNAEGKAIVQKAVRVLAESVEYAQ